MENLVMRPVWAQSGSELLATLDTVTAAESLLATYKLQAIQRLEEMGTAQELGARDTSELLSLRYRLNRTDVRKDLTLAAALPKYPAVTAALPDPDNPTRSATLSVEQARVIVTTLEKAPATVPVENLQVAEEQMVQAARVATPRDLTNLGHKVLATLDTDGPEPAEDEARTRECLRLRRADGGVRFSGFLAAENAELFATQIDKLSKPHKTIDGELDPRPRTKRQADALTTICEAAAGNPAYPGIPHITVTIDFDDLKTALTTNTNGQGEAAPGVGELELGGNLSAAAVRLMACDSAVLPIVLGGDSQPLDVGREQRFVTRHLRRALNKRDKGCVICKAPTWQCHAHHIIPWSEGGPTNLDHLVLVCSRDHRAIHSGQWVVTIIDGKVRVTRPTWADPNPTNLTAALTRLTTPDATPTINPLHEHPHKLPPASTRPNPTLTAARDAIRARLTSLAPNHHDPWTTPAPSP